MTQETPKERLVRLAEKWTEAAAKEERYDGMFNALDERAAFLFYVSSLFPERTEGEDEVERVARVRTCTVCGAATDIACSDCQIDFATAIYVCQKTSCQKTHEERCSAIVRRERAEAREKFIMHTAHVQAWLAMLTEIFGVKAEKVADACAGVIDAAKALVARLAASRKALEAVLARGDGAGGMMVTSHAEQATFNLCKTAIAALSPPARDTKESGRNFENGLRHIVWSENASDSTQVVFMFKDAEAAGKFYSFVSKAPRSALSQLDREAAPLPVSPEKDEES